MSLAPRKLKVLHVTEASCAGVGGHMLDLAEGLQARGCENHLIHSPLRMDATFTERLQALSYSGGQAVAMRRMPHWSDWRAKNAIARYIAAHGPFDIVHGHSTKAGGLTRLNGVSRRAKVVYTPNGIFTMNPSSGKAIAAVARWVENKLAPRSAAIIAVSPEERAHMLRIGFPEDRVHLIPNGLRPLLWGNGSELRQQFRIPPEALTIGFLGRLAPQKNPLLMLTAFARLRPPADRPLRLMMVGTGPLEQRARKFAGQLGIADRVDWLGFQTPAAAMPAFNIFAMPSRYEGMPYVLMEAVSAGAPVVATQVGGATLSVSHGVNGFVVPSSDPMAFAAALQSLVDQPDLRAIFAAAALKKAAEFSLPKMVDATLKLYWSLVEPGDNRPFAPKTAQRRVRP